MWAFLERFMEREELEVDGQVPHGAGDSIGTLVEFACQQAAAGSSVGVPDGDGVAVGSAITPGVPVFTASWAATIGIDSDAGSNTAREQAVAEVVSAWLDLTLHQVAALAPQWDGAFLEATELAATGPADALHGGVTAVGRNGADIGGSVSFGYARLLRWRCAAAPLANRELLFLVVPCRLPRSHSSSGGGGDGSSGSGSNGAAEVAGSGGGLLLTYISVRSPRYPCGAGFTRARHLVPSFDAVLAGTADAPGAALQLLLCRSMTTDMGGWVAPCAWNAMLRPVVASNCVAEANRVRGVLHGPRLRQTQIDALCAANLIQTTPRFREHLPNPQRL